MKIIIPGRPVPAKNHPVMVRPGLLLPSKPYRQYRDFCLGKGKRPGWLAQYGNIHFPGPVALCARYWLPDKRWWPDLVGLLQATSDILQAAGLIDNDRNIISYDGSRIMGLDKANPRVEITIKEWKTK